MRYLRTIALAGFAAAALCGAAMAQSYSGTFSVTATTGSAATVSVSGIRDFTFPAITEAGLSGRQLDSYPICITRSTPGLVSVTIDQLGGSGAYQLLSTTPGLPQVIVNFLINATGDVPINPGGSATLSAGTTCLGFPQVSFQATAYLPAGTPIPPGLNTYSGQFQITVAPL